MNLERNRPNVGLFFEPLIKSYVEAPHFVERSWLAERVEESLADPGCRFLLLTAEPGAGKTAFAAWLVHQDQHRDWPRYFIRRDSQTPLSSGDARSFLFAVGHQLAALYPGLFRSEQLELVVKQRIGELREGGRAVGIRVEDLKVSPFYQTALKVEQDVQLMAGELAGISIRRVVAEPRFLEIENLQYLALLDPAAALLKRDPAARLIVLIDALDELRYYPGHDNILNWLADCPELPPNVRIVLTSRPDNMLDHLRHRQQPWLRELEIQTGSGEVRTDLSHYATIFVTQKPIAEALRRHRLSGETFVERAITAAEGNFQYLAVLFRGIEQALEGIGDTRLLPLLELKSVPAGLAGLYAFFMRQLRECVGREHIEIPAAGVWNVVYLPAWEGLYQPLLGTLSVAREPLKQGQLATLSRVKTEARWVPGAVARLTQFLDQEGGRLRLYHTSLPEFLISRKTWHSYPDCYLSAREWHRRVIASYLEVNAGDWSACDDYGLNHLAEHVVAADLDEEARTAALDQILSDTFMQARLQAAGWHFPYMQDLYLLKTVDPIRVAAMCLAIIEGPQPNSLVMQRALRLLVELRPDTSQIGNPRSPNHKAINEVVRILSEAPPDAAAQLNTILDRVKNLRVKSVAALALGEVGSQRAALELLEMLKTARRQGSWAAADALIALNDRSIIPALVDWYDETDSAADKERIIYILGWMHAEGARELLPRALAASRAKIVGRGVDLMWLLPPAADDAGILLGHLQRVVDSDPRHPAQLGTWADEWLQKRLVRTIDKTGLRRALPDLKRLQVHIANRGKPRDLDKRRRLETSIGNAIKSLESG